MILFSQWLNVTHSHSYLQEYRSRVNGMSASPVEWNGAVEVEAINNSDEFTHSISSNGIYSELPSFQWRKAGVVDGWSGTEAANIPLYEKFFMRTEDNNTTICSMYHKSKLVHLIINYFHLFRRRLIFFFFSFTKTSTKCTE